MSVSKKVDLYFFRHGETDWNKEGKIQGYTDIPLNETGLKQANELSKITETLDFEVILSSDLLRAKKTAEIIAATKNSPTIITKDLREINLGWAEGKTREYIDAIKGSEVWNTYTSPHPNHLDFRFQDGESKREHIARVVNFIEKFILQTNHQKIAISTHGASIRNILQAKVKNLSKEKFVINNCCLYHVLWNNHEWELVGKLN